MGYIFQRKAVLSQALGQRLPFSAPAIHEMTVAPLKSICNLTGDIHYNRAPFSNGTHCIYNPNHLRWERAHLVLSSSKRWQEAGLWDRRLKIERKGSGQRTASARQLRSSSQVSQLLNSAPIYQFILIGRQAGTCHQQQSLLLGEQPLGLSLHKLLVTVSILNVVV